MKKKPAEEAKGDNSGRWMLTYSDMITLLLALFIVLYSMSTINAKKYQQVSQAMHSAFKTTESTSGGGAGNGIGNAIIAASQSSKASSSKTQQVPSLQNDALGEIYSILNAFVTSNHLQNQVQITKSSEYVQIRVVDMVMFQPDTATMLPASEPIVKEIEQAIAKVYGQVDHITISGHTADVVENGSKSDEISWQLSTERAVTVLNRMLDYGLSGKKLSIQGYAHHVPVAPNDTESNRAKNRRVEITIYKSPSLDVASQAAQKTASRVQKKTASTASAASSQTGSATSPYADASSTAGTSSSASSK